MLLAPKAARRKKTETQRSLMSTGAWRKVCSTCGMIGAIGNWQLAIEFAALGKMRRERKVSQRFNQSRCANCRCEKNGAKERKNECVCE